MPEARPLHTPRPPAGNSVLIVDDDRVTRRLLEELLGAEGFAILTGEDGHQALALARRHLPDVILLDVLLPGLDGFEVCRRLRADPVLAEVPILLLTALDDRASRELGMAAGADDFLTKPFDRLELLARVRAITRLNRFRRLLEERVQLQRTEEALHGRLRDLEVLNQVLADSANSLDEAEVLGIGARALATAFAPAEVRVHQRVGEGPSFELRSADGEQAGRSLALSALGDPACVRRLLAEPISYIVAPSVANGARGGAPIADHLLVPLLHRQAVAGAVEIVPRRPRAFQATDIALAEGVATAMAQAWESARLYRQLQVYAETLEETVAARTRELAGERDRIRAILEALGEAAFVTDETGRVQYVNPAAVELTGYGRDELIGVPLGRWHPDRRVERVFERLAQRPDIDLGELWWEGELVGRRKDGTYFDAVLTVAPLPSPAEPGRAIGFVGVQRDITPLKEAERMKHRFASNVSHELRTPLSVITLLSGNLDALGDRIAPDKRVAMVKDIRRHAQVLDELITDVLEMSSIDSGRISPELHPLDLVPLLRDEIQRLGPLAERRGQSFSASGVESLPVHGDGRQLRRVVRNLINNAVKYTPEGGRIECEWTLLDIAQAGARSLTWPQAETLEAGRWAGVRICDNGPGIPEPDLGRIFERFYRINSQSNIPGTGLGLAITRELVLLHSGRVAVASVPGEGSCFVFYLPLSPSTHEPGRVP